MSYFFTSESVTEGHPDKIADQISDTVLDACLAKDPHARVACETLVSKNLVVVSGEITSKTVLCLEPLVRKVILDIGYDDIEKGFDGQNANIFLAVGKQSPDIQRGVDGPEHLGAGDQGLMFGYAVRESKQLMPYSISFAHQLAKRLAQVRKEGILKGLRPDGKTQVTVEYGADHQIQRVDAVVVSAQHEASVSLKELREGLIEEVIIPTVPSHLLDKKTRFWINPTGRFVLGGPAADCGLTGRKIIVDTYGGHGAHGGGSFSGKDPSKVDRSAAYMARYIAKNLVATGWMDRCLIQFAYAIGISEPIRIHIEAFGTEKKPLSKIKHAVRKVFDLTPEGMIESLKLLRPIYAKTATYGHFGREEPEFFWEKTDKVPFLKELL